ncbi:hypothetical protein [Salinarimonas ramus]|uniref:Uncharacterized protein n=1 Tax=Salinarimonas ramus TaxID=690164 RepID=A0A917Q5Z5_9HYPH|nr:hypothetical protein [Salinarimonas ramus]GGK29870.1 hypothetical protein GCM10011322_15430 [Salinarimonas ramus]
MTDPILVVPGMLERLLAAVATRGDLAHLALLAWALAASFFALLLLREAAQASRRFDAFVRELARFNRRFSGDDR